MERRKSTIDDSKWLVVGGSGQVLGAGWLLLVLERRLLANAGVGQVKVLMVIIVVFRCRRCTGMYPAYARLVAPTPCLALYDASLHVLHTTRLPPTSNSILQNTCIVPSGAPWMTNGRV